MTTDGRTAETTPAGRKIGRFRTVEARTRFELAYDAALASWPIEARPIDLSTPFGSTRVNTCGAATGVPIVLLHSMLATSTSWAPNVAALGANHPVFAVDVVCDAGKSVQERPVRTGEDLERWLTEVLTSLGLDRPHLVGLSFGAWVALNQALRSPTQVRSVTAIEPPGAITRGKIGFMIKFVRAGLRRSDKDFDRVIRLLGNGKPPPPAILEVIRCGFRDFKLALPFAKLLDDDQLATLRTPVLLLFGADSPMSDSRRAVERARRLLPDVEAELVAGTAHTPPMEDPHAVNARILQFVTRVESTGDVR